jgi:hypothetical protein
VSDLERLARHLGELGEISISRLDPERTVAWEGERTRGTVEIEASGWGTRVTLTAEVVEDAPAGEVEVTRGAGVEEAAPPVESDVEKADPRAPGPVDAGTKEIEVAGGERPAGEVEETPSSDGPATGEPLVEPESPLMKTFRPLRDGFARWLFRERRSAPAPETDPPTASQSVRDEPVQEPLESEALQEPPEAEPLPAPEPPPRADIEPRVEVASELPPEVAPQPEAVDSERVREIFESALDSLGAAHHRPFSRG